MKKVTLIACLCAGMALASCGGSGNANENAARTDTTAVDDTLIEGQSGSDPEAGRLSEPDSAAAKGPGDGDRTGVDNGDKQ